MTITTQPNPADVPAPPDATERPGSWDEDSERYFCGTDRDGVRIHGFQITDGSVRTRWVSVSFERGEIDLGEMSAAEARRVGCNLIAAADELERLEAADRTASA